MTLYLSKPIKREAGVRNYWGEKMNLPQAYFSETRVQLVPEKLQEA